MGHHKLLLTATGPSTGVLQAAVLLCQFFFPNDCAYPSMATSLNGEYPNYNYLIRVEIADS
jgi:hypothetical protein